MSTADSTAGMQRFVICRFPMVVNKILPDASPEALTATLASDPDFFNDLAYDDVVKAVANIMFFLANCSKRCACVFRRCPSTRLLDKAPDINLKAPPSLHGRAHPRCFPVAHILLCSAMPREQIAVPVLPRFVSIMVPLLYARACFARSVLF